MDKMDSLHLENYLAGDFCFANNWAVSMELEQTGLALGAGQLESHQSSIPIISKKWKLNHVSQI